MTDTITPLSYSMKSAAAACGLSVATLERAINAGRLRAKFSSQNKDGDGVGNRLILHSDLMAFLDGLPDA